MCGVKDNKLLIIYFFMYSYLLWPIVKMKAIFFEGPNEYYNWKKLQFLRSYLEKWKMCLNFNFVSKFSVLPLRENMYVGNVIDFVVSQ